MESLARGNCQRLNGTYIGKFGYLLRFLYVCVTKIPPEKNGLDTEYSQLVQSSILRTRQRFKLHKACIAIHPY